ncbi:MAG: ABC transporter substrate-binding protein [Acidobacteriota bacterium]
MTRKFKTFLAFSAAALMFSACNQDKPVKIGAVLPLTGQWEVYGDPIRKGVELAAEQLAQDPAQTVAIELDIRDSESNAENAAAVLEALYAEGALAAVGGVTTAEALAMIPVVDKKDRVLISPSATSPRLTGISRTFYRVAPSDFREGAKMGNYAAQGLQLTKVAIIAAESPYARGIQDVFKSEFERYGGEVPGVVEYPSGTTEFEPFIDEVLAFEPQAVYVADYAFEIAGIISEIRDKGFKGRILTTHALNAPGVFENLGAKAENVLLTQSVFDVASDDPAVKNFVVAYQEKYGELPNVFAAQAYDALGVLASALQNGGRLPNEFQKGMRSLSDFTGASGAIQFDEKGDVGKFPRVYAFEGGQLVDFEKRTKERLEELKRRMEEIKRRQREEARRQNTG